MEKDIRNIICPDSTQQLKYTDGNFGKIDMVLFPGGYATISGTTVTFHYYTQDYLGNNRAVVNGTTGTIEQTTAYYPYGAVIPDFGTGNTGQPFKFGGKELISANGLNMYDFGARLHYPAIPHFTSIDPLSEKYYWLSPYLYCANNPVNLVDLFGEEPTPEESVRNVYGKYKDDILIGNWEKTPDNLGIQLNNGNGLKSAIYQRVDDDGNAIEFACVFAGTEKEWDDIKADILQPLGLSSQHANAVEDALKIIEEVGDDKLTAIGHSLGGGESSLISIVTGIPAITFNAAGISDITKIVNGNLLSPLKSEQNIKAYIMTTDPLNILQDRLPIPKVNGVRHYVNPVNFKSVVDGHSIDSMLKSFGVDPQEYKINP